jgi:hypothetical protein
MPDGRCGSADLGCWDRRETGVDSALVCAAPRPGFDTAWGRLAVPGPSG